MNDLKVPYGLNNAGGLISAVNASSEDAYFCPCCAEHLIYRAGDVRVKHFSHPTGSNCSYETIIHIIAKLLIEDVINSNATDQLIICISNKCQGCGLEYNSSLPPKTFSSAKQEIRVLNYICDVVGYRGNEIALAVEILNTHKVDSKKASNLPVYWIELNAYDVINNPKQWNPTQSHLKSTFCRSCKDHIEHIKRVADKMNIDRNLYSAIKNPISATYIAETEVCFKCKEEVPVFWWQGVPFCEIEPPNPKPKTIKYRYSKNYGGSYWANTCGKCSMIQGDNHLFIFKSAPFKDMPLDTEKVRDFKGGVKAVSSSGAVSEFMKVITRNL